MSHYETLGVAKNASLANIKKAYHKLALRHHPNKGGNAEKFKPVGAAFAILSDAEKRAKYDVEIAPVTKTGDLAKKEAEKFLDEFLASPGEFDRATLKYLIERAEQADLYADERYSKALKIYNEMYKSKKSRGATPKRSGGGGGGGAAGAAGTPGGGGRAAGGGGKAAPLSEEDDTLLEQLSNAAIVATEETMDIVKILLENAQERGLTGRSRYKQAEATYEKLKTKFATKSKGSKKRRTRKL